MTPEQIDANFKGVANHLRSLHINLLRSIARTKAMETMIEDSMPEESRKEWREQLDRETKIRLQRLLEVCERQNPGFAASIDDRSFWEVPDGS